MGLFDSKQSGEKATKRLTLRALAAALDIAPGQLSREVKKHTDFPRHVESGKTRFLLDEVTRWRSNNIKTRSAAQPAVAPPPPGSSIATTLNSDTATSLELTKAAVRMAAKQLAASGGAANMHALEKLLQELRQAETDEINLAERREQLVPRADVLAVISECCGRLVLCFSLLETTLTTEVEVWLPSDEVRRMDAEARKRMVRDFVRRAGHAIRQQEADGAEVLAKKYAAEKRGESE